MTNLLRVLTIIGITIIIAGCLMIMVASNLDTIQDTATARRAQAEAERAEAEAKRAQAQTAQIQAEGERELAQAAARAIDRQGRLLTLSILSNGIRSFIFGMVAGSATTFGTIYILSHRRALCNARAVDSK